MAGVPTRGEKNTSAAVMSQRRVSRAVGERHAALQVDRDTPEGAKWRKLNYFATPPWGTRAGAELIRALDPLSTMAFDPACGEGTMSEVLFEYFPTVHASDINDYGRGYRVSDFLLDAPTVECDWIITNPPFSHAAEFVQRGLEIARHGVAVICRSVFLEGEDRFAVLYRGDCPLAVVAPFTERLPMQLGPWNPALSSATAYSWFFFMKPGVRQAAGIGLRPEVIPIGPGTRDRLWMPTDIRRFAKTVDMPLFDTRGSDDKDERITA